MHNLLTHTFNAVGPHSSLSAVGGVLQGFTPVP
jgi:hypothetical protein